MKLVVAAGIGLLVFSGCGHSTKPPPDLTPVRPSLTGHWVGALIEPNDDSFQRLLEFRFDEAESTLTGEVSIDNSGFQRLSCLAWADTLKLILPTDVGGFLSFIGTQNGYALSGTWGAWSKHNAIDTGSWYANKH